MVEAEACATAVPTSAFSCPLASLVVTWSCAWTASGVPRVPTLAEKSLGIVTTAA